MLGNKLIAPIVMLTAGLITSIFNLVNQNDSLFSLVSLLIVLIIFYIIGTIAKMVFVKITKPKVEAKEDIQQEDTKIQV